MAYFQEEPLEPLLEKEPVVDSLHHTQPEEIRNLLDKHTPQVLRKVEVLRKLEVLQIRQDDLRRLDRGARLIAEVATLVQISVVA